MVRFNQLFKKKQIKILLVQQLKNQNSMTFTCIKLSGKTLPFFVYTGASAQWENGQNKDKLVCMHCLALAFVAAALL